MTSICIIDDDKTDRFIIERALLSIYPGLDIFQADNEESGFSLVSEMQPDIVVMDVNLVGSCGHMLAKRLKKHLGKDNVTIVMMSGFVQAKSMRYAATLDRKDVIVKPMRISDYPEFVNQIMSAHGTVAQVERAAEVVAA